MIDRKEQNRLNRNFGKAAERRIAKRFGGERTPLSGAVKYSNRNLTGDVELRDAMGRDFMKLEVKATAKVTPSGDKQFNLKKSVLDQTFREAHEAHEIGALVIHFKNDTEDYFVFAERDIAELIELAKLGCLYEATIEKDKI